MNYFKTLVFCASSFAWVSGAGAQSVLLEWDMSGVDQSTATLAASVIASNISSSSPSGVLSRGAGAALPGSTGSNNFGASGFNSTSLADAITNGDYYTFSVTAASGFALNLSAIEYNMEITTSGPTNGALFSSVTGFGSANAIATYGISTSTGGGDQTVTMTGLTALQGVTGTVEFRIYAWGGGSGTTDKFRFRNLSSGDLQISGTVVSSPVPEPAAYAALTAGIVLAGVVMRRKRRKNSSSRD